MDLFGPPIKSSFPDKVPRAVPSNPSNLRAFCQATCNTMFLTCYALARTKLEQWRSIRRSRPCVVVRSVLEAAPPVWKTSTPFRALENSGPVSFHMFQLLESSISISTSVLCCILDSGIPRLPFAELGYLCTFPFTTNVGRKLSFLHATMTSFSLRAGTCSSQ